MRRRKGVVMRNLFICALCITSLYAETPYTVNMFIKEYPYEKNQNEQVAIDPLIVPKSMMKKAFYQPVTSGIYGTYNGYLAPSNQFGLISFPRQTQRAQFNLVITPTIKPTFLLDNTINQWHITDHKQTSMFQVKQQKDVETKLYYWKVQQTNLPKDSAIPLHSIVILSKSKNIYAPLGVTVTKKLPNLVLPPIYAKRGLDHIKQALFVLKIKQFFAPVKKLVKADKLSRQMIITA